MNRGLFEGAEAMRASERRMEAIATNLANISVTGYKRRSTTTESFDVALRGELRRHVRTKVAVNHAQGPLQHTGEKLDLALSGEGYFAVETQAGEAYTRGGKFRIDQDGVLQNLDGYAVAWEGARGFIDPAGEEVMVDPEGQVWQGTNQVGRLRIVGFDDPSKLEPDRKGYLHAPDGLRETAHQANVRQGHLESSNVSPMEEMVALISAQRSFEATARLMGMIEQSYHRLTAN